jgi:geranylgeranyl pyrophosphate synthase
MPSNHLSSAVEVKMLQACSTLTKRSINSKSKIRHAIDHHLGAGGNRVRAQFSLDASHSLAVSQSDAVTLAAICELLHNASLIHDDLLDRAPLRRGLPSVWAAFGDSTAVCAGDLMLAGAFALVAELCCIEFIPEVLALVHQRTQDVIFGQDAEQSSTPSTFDDYEQIAVAKSASLLSLPFELSLLVSHHKQFLPTAVRASQAFASAYQILDDMEDYGDDTRNGSLNAVSVALSAGSPDYASACVFVCRRANDLLLSAVTDAADLPMRCGTSMISYADRLRESLRTHHDAAIGTSPLLKPTEPCGPLSSVR